MAARQVRDRPTEADIVVVVVVIVVVAVFFIVIDIIIVVICVVGIVIEGCLLPSPPPKYLSLTPFPSSATVQRLLAAVPPQLGKSSNQSHSFGICLL